LLGHHELPPAVAACATALPATGDSVIGPDAADTAIHPMNAAINSENSVFSENPLKAFVIFVLLVCSGGVRSPMDAM
jgi:hypothetical protein